ncbi:MAG: nucleotidyltransferase family protein [Pseudomonadota bacterium]|nr:nucleotidyltransferase family protein [Pseudomonadota bacterium]
MNQTRIHLEAQLTEILFPSPLLERILKFAPESRLPDWHLCAGCLTQTVWNALSGYTYDRGIDDIDLIYFDADDLSEASEAANATLIAQSFPGIGIHFDVKNEARVHIWYEARFGRAIQPYRSIADAVATFPTTATAIAVHPSVECLEIVAPFGLDDLFTGVVRPNKALVTRDVYEDKIARWRRIWPDLTYLSWSETV